MDREGGGGGYKDGWVGWMHKARSEQCLHDALWENCMTSSTEVLCKWIAMNCPAADLQESFHYVKLGFFSFWCQCWEWQGRHLLRAVRMSVAAVASKPEVGSSMNSRDGLDTSSSPMFTLLRCPPLQAHTHTQLQCALAQCLVAEMLTQCAQRLIGEILAQPRGRLGKYGEKT